MVELGPAALGLLCTKSTRKNVLMLSSDYYLDLTLWVQCVVLSQGHTVI